VADLSTERSTRFLSAFKAIEDHLRRQSVQARRDDGSRLPFYALVDLLAATNIALRFHAGVLKEYADLRNAIIHWGPQPDAIAEPHDSVVRNIEKMRKVLLTPALLTDLFHRQVVTCSPDDLLGGVIELMRAKQYSQMPVFNKQISALLTTNTIVRWLATQKNGINLAGVRVGAVLNEAETKDNFETLSASANIFDALAVFEARLQQGWDFDALLVTRKGSAHETPLAIFTPWDYPKLASKAGLPAAPASRP
jgi:hypothetical protein